MDPTRKSEKVGKKRQGAGAGMRGPEGMPPLSDLGKKTVEFARAFTKNEKSSQREKYSVHESADAINGKLDQPIHRPADPLERLKLLFNFKLNELHQILISAPELREEFLKHALFREVFPDSSQAAKMDPVAAEIAREVTIRWVDRKNEPHKGQPWVKNPKVFIEHVYSKWLQAGTLRRAHLAPDERLYQAYKQHLSRHPDEDLNLPTEKRTPVTDPLATIESRRAANAEKARLRRASKKVPS